MALRFAARLGAAQSRRFSTKPVPLGAPGNLKASVNSAMGEVSSFSPAKFFEEKYFWGKANLGPFFLMLLLTPTIYRSVKDFYWTRALRKLNTEEIISDRYDWLRMNMLQDEVEAGLLEQVPAGGIPALTLGPATPP
mmetsp:Transcript_21418/g.63921  ORF Transcript_21418/g.63921 Transcript_21418/m.63921 type:complete len:137 (-) Transcript_21418:138-548(-)